MPAWAWAGIWGFVAGSALLLGAAVGYFVIGVSLIGGGTVSWVAVVAIFVSNIPEGLSSAAGMRKAGRSLGYVSGVWGGIALASGLAALAGFAIFRALPAAAISVTTAVAAGAMLAMISDTMIPEAFEDARDATGLVTVLGFLAAFLLTKLGA
jgi:ZIP family zinc transporter